VRERVLIVDDHAGFRAWARSVLEEEGYRIVGEARDGTSAIAMVREVQPGIVLLDIQLPDIDGFEVAVRVLSQPDPQHHREVKRTVPYEDLAAFMLAQLADDTWVGRAPALLSSR
jgi:CheY-like chemotaxis protein